MHWCVSRVIQCKAPQKAYACVYMTLCAFLRVQRENFVYMYLFMCVCLCTYVSFMACALLLVGVPISMCTAT